ncbi:histidine phosphatase super family protein [Collimonas fungivorans]|jgi:broad specificity phosphatase PhoE|uniref:Histidine phosphatase super family protein n=1 Tax=Collimonas fungivorans TaxID=158899 RepID=A0A127PHG6_9BURK|nr:histidine phosphatase family protein [Collimonas fungivorans]AMO97259.1 histidine phosphatase super family protein [Collimonas fungivorans]
MGSIYLVRHGQASFGAADYDQLSELGLRQSALLGKWLAQTGQEIPLLVTGSHRRQLQSSAACLAAMSGNAAGPELKVLEDPGFDEFDHKQILLRFMPRFADSLFSAYLEQQEHPERAFQRVFVNAVARWVSGEHDAEYSEPWPVFKERCNAALARLLAQLGKGQTAWVFTSGGPISVICQQLLAIPDRQIFDLNWSLANTGVTKLLYRSGRDGPERVSLSYLNNFSHLVAACDPALVSYR